MPARVTVVTGEDFVRVANALRAIDASLPRELRKEMKDAVKPAVREAQADVRSMNVVGGPAGHTGLRSKVARGVRVRAGVSSRRGASLRVVTTMPTANMAVIPRGLDSRSFRNLGGGWKHPVFGRGEVFQKGGSWFMDNMQESKGPIKEALTDVLERARNRVARSG